MKMNKPAQPADSELREQIASTMMSGWMKSLKGGSYLVDGIKYPKTKLAINPDVLDSLLQLIAAHDAQRDQQKKKELLGQWPEQQECDYHGEGEEDNCLGCANADTHNKAIKQTRQIVERFYT